MNIVYLNGEFLPKEQAQVSVFDRGFLFGDGVYEVIPAFGGHLFRLSQHLTRLQQSLQAIDIHLQIAKAEWQSILQQLVQGNGGGDQAIYLQITRGVMEKRQHLYRNDLTPTIFAMSIPTHFKSAAELSQGEKAITHDDPRWQWCHIKAINLLASVLLYQQAHDAGAAEMLLLRDGQVMEGCTSNLLIVKNKTVITPPLNNFILGGVTRDFILEILREKHIPYIERPIPLAELRTADEIWISGSIKEIRPIVELDGKKVNDGAVGVIFQQLAQIYLAIRDSYARGNPP